MEYRFSSIGKLLVAVLLVLSTSFAFGQGITTGTISGTVVDPQGAVVSGATVTAKDVTTNREFTSTSDDTGAYAIRGVPVGTYTVTISAQNFKKVQIGNVQVYANRMTAMGSRALEVGGGEEVVDVEGTAPLVESTSSQVSTSFDSKKVTDLPVNNAFDALALMTPGMASAGDAGFSNNNGADLSANGQRGRSNNFQIDGQSNNDNSVAGPSFFVSNADIIAEFQVITNNFSAEYGRNMGSVVNYVTKSGTNAFHGTAHWFHRNHIFDSLRNQERSPLFSHPFTGLPFCSPSESPGATCSEPRKSRDLTNRFGFTFGGPVVTDKLWFFGSGEDERQRIGGSPFSSGNSLTPTPAGIAALQAAFPNNPAVVHLATYGPYGQTVGNPTPGTTSFQTVNGCNVPPCGALTPVSVEMAAVTRLIPSLYGFRQWTGRVDWQVSDKDRFFARYLNQGFNNAGAFGTGRFAGGSWVDVPGRAQQIGLDWSRSWTSHFINQVRWSYSRASFDFDGGSWPFCTAEDLMDCPTGVQFASAARQVAFGMQNNLPQNRLVNNTQFQDNASWVVGRHTLKFGGEYDRQRSPNIFLPNVLGTFTCGSVSAYLQGNCTASVADGPQGITYKEQDMAFYFQDDWRVLDNLTLNLGLRWEWFEQAVNILNDLTVARETGPDAFWDPSLPIEAKTVPAVPEDRNNWGPNIGFAWTPRIWEGLFGRDKTVIRGGYRIAYDPAFYNIFLNMQTAAPTVNAATLAGRGLPVGFPATGQGLRDAGFFAAIPTGACGTQCDPRRRNATTVASDFHNPYTQQWSLGVQRQITSKIAAEVRYVGNHTVGNFLTLNRNPRIDRLFASFPEVLPAGITPCTDAAAPGFRRVFCENSLIRERQNGAFSIYHGLQSRVDIQNWHGVTAGMGYTWSRAIDNVSEIFSTFGGGNTIAGAQNPFDPTVAERGVGGTSFPHVFGTYWIYELPWMKSQEGVVGHLLGGWQINGTYRFQSGQPWTPAQFAGVWGDFCDSTFDIGFFGGGDTCRPFLSNPNAPIDSVGFCSDFTAPDCGLIDAYADGFPSVTPDQVHWIINSFDSALFFGTPYGVGRNTLRGQTTNNMDFGVFKNTKITEKVTVQFQWNTFNLFNRQFRGVPDPFLEDCPITPVDSDPNNSLMGCGGAPGSAFNNQFNTSNRRRMIFGLKLIF